MRGRNEGAELQVRGGLVPGQCVYQNAVALGWLDAWKANGWKKAGGEEPANARLWKDFYLLSHAMHKVAVKGYDGKYRERLEALLSGGCGAGPGGM